MDANKGYELWEATPKCYLYTMVFQAFVFMQCFNQFNARLLGDREFNFLARITDNWIFIGIAIVTFGVQTLMMMYGGEAVRCVRLTLEQNLWCLGIGAGSLIWGIISKFLLPYSLFNCLASRPEKVMDDKNEKSSLVSSLRVSQRQKSIKRQNSRVGKGDRKSVV